MPPRMPTRTLALLFALAGPLGCVVVSDDDAADSGSGSDGTGSASASASASASDTAA